jgi:zinc transport system substrate-binding protein
MQNARQRSVWCFPSFVSFLILIALASCYASGVVFDYALASVIRPKVMVSVPPLFAAIREIAGGDFEVLQSLPSGRSEHGYEPSPRDVKRLRSADLIVIVDEATDGWMVKLADKVSRMEILPAVQPLTYQQTSGQALGSAATTLGARLDPHFWTDPVRMGMAAVAVAARLDVLKPGTPVVQRAALFDARMKKLAVTAADKAKNLPNVSAILSHASLGYFAKWSGLKVVGFLEPVPHVEPGPRHLRDLVKIAKANTPCRILAEEQLDRKTANVLAKEVGVIAKRINPLGSVSSRSAKSPASSVKMAETNEQSDEGAYDRYVLGLLDEIAGALK